MTTIDDIQQDFEFLDDWEDRYRYVIELGNGLPNFADEHRTDANKVQGCVSQVWMISQIKDEKGDRKVYFQGDSDAHIVRGLIAVLLALFNGKSPQTILDTDAVAVLNGLGLKEHLSPQRSNGLYSMINRMKSDAQSALVS